MRERESLENKSQQLICIFILCLHSPPRLSPAAHAVHLLDRDTHPLCNTAKPRRVCGPAHFYSYRDLVCKQSLLHLLAIIQQLRQVSGGIMFWFIPTIVQHEIIAAR